MEKATLKFLELEKATLRFLELEKNVSLQPQPIMDSFQNNLLIHIRTIHINILPVVEIIMLLPERTRNISTAVSVLIIILRIINVIPVIKSKTTNAVWINRKSLLIVDFSFKEGQKPSTFKAHRGKKILFCISSIVLISLYSPTK